MPEVVLYTENGIYAKKYFTNNVVSSNSTSNFIVATGGVITYSGNYKIHTFTSNGTFTVKQNVNAEVLVVAGGGGGGGDTGGGGGGGEPNEQPPGAPLFFKQGTAFIFPQLTDVGRIPWRSLPLPSSVQVIRAEATPVVSL